MIYLLTVTNAAGSSSNSTVDGLKALNTAINAAMVTPGFAYYEVGTETKAMPVLLTPELIEATKAYLSELRAEFHENVSASNVANTLGEQKAYLSHYQQAHAIYREISEVQVALRNYRELEAALAQ